MRPRRRRAVSLESVIEEQIRKAMAEGEFDDLPGKGEPLDLKGYFETPESLRMCYSILKNANIVPEEVELLKEIEALKARLGPSRDETERAAINRAIAEKTLTFNTLMDTRRRRK